MRSNLIIFILEMLPWIPDSSAHDLSAVQHLRKFSNAAVLEC